MVRLQPIIDRFCGWSGVCSLHGPAHRRQLLFIMRKMKRQGLHQGRRASTKKAYVKLKKDSKGIEFFDSIAQ